MHGDTELVNCPFVNVQVMQGENKPMMNGDDKNLNNSNSPSPLLPEAGGSSRNSSPEASSFASSFVRNSARKSLGNGLSMQKWFCAQEKVMEQLDVSIACTVYI